jgi:hypothetical protein
VSVRPDSLQAEKCYLITDGRVAPVLKVFPRGDVHCAVRSGNVPKAFQWTGAVADVQSFSDLVEREVPCDWSPEGED